MYNAWNQVSYLTEAIGGCQRNSERRMLTRVPVTRGPTLIIDSGLTLVIGLQRHSGPNGIYFKLNPTQTIRNARL